MKTLRKIITVCTLCSGLAFAQAQPTVIAHRGYWKADGAAQNSIVALEKAAEAKLYGSEFDVQLTADGVVVVNHDETINGLTIADTPYSLLKQQKLSNGEKLPSLDDYLKRGKELDIQLILEIKPHQTKQLEDQISEKVVGMVKAYGMEKQVEYISFSLNVCEQLVKLTPGSEISYLEGDLSPKEAKGKGFTGIDYEYTVFNKHPEWVKEAHSLGMKVNTWTVNRKKDLRKMIGLGVDFLTTNEPLLATDLIGASQSL